MLVSVCVCVYVCVCVCVYYMCVHAAACMCVFVQGWIQNFLCGCVCFGSHAHTGGGVGY